MKKFMICIMTAVLLLSFNPMQSLAAEATPISTPVSNSAEAEKVNVMIKRLNEIDAMDKSNLSSSEKRVLRKEVRGIKREIQRSTGVYVSVGVLLLIIIILLLL
jgi:hypothetical protein